MDQQYDSFNSHSNHCNSGDAMAISVAGMTIDDRHHGEQLENGISPMKGEVATGKSFQPEQMFHNIDVIPVIWLTQRSAFMLLDLSSVCTLHAI